MERDKNPACECDAVPAMRPSRLRERCAAGCIRFERIPAFRLSPLPQSGTAGNVALKSLAAIRGSEPKNYQNQMFR
jgi:hypothetical protein